MLTPLKKDVPLQKTPQQMIKIKVLTLNNWHSKILKLSENSKMRLNLKLEIYTNLENEPEIYSNFKLKNKLKFFWFFVNGR